ncbi:hypothetical protein Pla163_10590 [Planctomycetes bacterium Pla163]|uniref:SGNH hydrolase-type esterase domain-containing protein n=1 Tax=Rohdeia mirabilis TaxID=2528008 RepID=A0A518CXL6_9BACT|nr:hypothetical protein Pla163_10590 [Planctomycetes bacterium Pla163]
MWNLGRTPLLSLVALAPIALAQPAQADEPLRVLFLGNSYTQVNDLPGLLEQLAASLGRTLETDRNTPGGNTLGVPQGNGGQHVSNPVSLQKIASGNWDAVVLQDQSTMPTIQAMLDTYTRPAVQSLESDVRAASPAARVVLYMTWGRENGGGPFCVGSACSPAFGDFDAMQSSLAAAYASLAETAVDAEVAPVGLAWQRHLGGAQPADLFAADGSHPSLAGSYLAACVFYARLFDASPVGAPFTAGLAPADALALQIDAWEAVQQYDCGTRRIVDGLFDLELVGGGSIGALARFRLSGPFGPVPVAVFAISALPAAIQTPGGQVGIDLGALLVGPVVVTPQAPAAAAAFGVAVPADPALVGLELYVQGAAFEAGGFVLGDALEWRPCP